MNIGDFDQWVRSQMDFSIKDAALNGLQVGKLTKPLRRIAFALDACQHSFNLAQKADLLFVHHGLFWGNAPINDDLAMYDRIKQLIQNDTALYAVHLPLDGASHVGNNAVLAQKVQLHNLRPFAGIGLIGQLTQPIYSDELAKRVFGSYPCTIWSHHNRLIERVAVLSGGGARSNFVQEAIHLQADAYLTGEINHQIYHYTSELGLNVIAGGHYWSEFIGLSHFAHVVQQAFPELQVDIYDLPTGC